MWSNKLNKVIRDVCGEKKGTGCKSPEHKEYHCFGESDCPECTQNVGYNEKYDEIADKEVEVDVDKIAACLRDNQYKEYAGRGGFTDESSKEYLAKAIAKEILKGNVIKVKESK